MKMTKRKRAPQKNNASKRRKGVKSKVQIAKVFKHGMDLFEFHGVSWDSGSKKWRVQRYFGGKSFYNGIFESEEEAAKASDDLLREKKLWSLKLNFPTDVTIL